MRDVSAVSPGIERKRGRARLCRRAVFAGFIAGILTMAGASMARAGSQLPFPRPASIEPNVSFWVQVFADYSYRDFVVLDRDDVFKVYQVFHLPGDGPPTRDEIEWVNAYLKTKYGEILDRLASGADPMGSDERRVAAMFQGKPAWVLRDAEQNLHVQEGLRERFREGLLRSKYYRPTMERIFRAAGLPVELVTLAQVESGFQRSVRSSAGAVGIWQFTRSTGRHFMTIRGHRDDRLNPARETAAAAKLLRYNYSVLGDWPLAITAYNYGTEGTAKAAEQCGNDYCRMLQTYSGRHFGFAVKNYYAEFLAALQVHQYEDDYFPGIAQQPAIVPASSTPSAPRHRKAKHSPRTASGHRHSPQPA